MVSLTAQKQTLVISALTLSVLVIGLDVTILNVALPAISSALDAGISGLQWVTNAYILAFAGLMLPVGSLVDRYGRRLALVTGLAIFGCASVWAAFTTTTAALTCARGLLGVGAAIIMPATLATIAAQFDAEDRGKALSIVVMGMGAGIPLGPIVGGYLIDHYTWGAIFLINVPLVLLAIGAVLWVLPESKDPTAATTDYFGAVTSTAGLSALVYGCIEAPGKGWFSPAVLGALTIGALLVGAFVLWERRAPEPMIDLALFAKPLFTWGTVNATVASFALFGLLFVVPLYLQVNLGSNAFHAGLKLLPLIGGFVVGVGLGTRVAGHLGHKIPITAGLVITAAGLAVGTLTTRTSGFGFVSLWLVLAGFGIGAALTPSMDAVLSVLPPERSGSGAAVVMTFRQVGGALGVAVLGSVLAQAYLDQLPTAGLPAPIAAAARDSVVGAVTVATSQHIPALAVSAQAAYLHAMVVVLGVCAGIVLVTAALTALLMPRALRPCCVAA